MIAINDGVSAKDAANRAMHAYKTHGGGGKTLRPEFQRRLQRAKIEWELNTPEFVTDRTTIDDFVYTTMHAPTSVDTDFINAAKRHAAIYDIVFLTPMSMVFNLDNDLSRLQDRGYHAVFETVAFALAQQWCLPDRLVKVPYSSRSDRRSFVIDVVNSVKAKN
jgi:hypothetical protein